MYEKKNQAKETLMHGKNRLSLDQKDLIIHNLIKIFCDTTDLVLDA